MIVNSLYKNHHLDKTQKLVASIFLIMKPKNSFLINKRLTPNDNESSFFLAYLVFG